MNSQLLLFILSITRKIRDLKLNELSIEIIENVIVNFLLVKKKYLVRYLKKREKNNVWLWLIHLQYRYIKERYRCRIHSKDRIENIYSIVKETQNAKVFQHTYIHTYLYYIYVVYEWNMINAYKRMLFTIRCYHLQMIYNHHHGPGLFEYLTFFFYFYFFFIFYFVHTRI